MVARSGHLRPFDALRVEVLRELEGLRLAPSDGIHEEGEALSEPRHKKQRPTTRLWRGESKGSATLPNVRTPYLRLRLPIIVRRVQRGEAKLVANTAKLGEYLALAPEELKRLAPLFPRPLPDSARPIRKRIDYVALRAQYEQLLADGTCATKADVARHVGVSRVWVSRVLRGFNRKTRR